MTKKFAARVTKKDRQTINMSDRFESDLMKRLEDNHLLQGARLEELRLKDIIVKDQVRTKFNDSSLRELAANIKENGLIQPLVVHREGDRFVLICGERRFRAMSSIPFEKAPCFILEEKSHEELMAIQFSENSSREALHFIDKADGILNYQKATKASERKITAALGISKSEVHRSLLIAKMAKDIKEAAKQHNTEKYVLLEYDALDRGALKDNVKKQILEGSLTKRAQLKRVVRSGGVVKAGKKARKSPELPKGLTANAFLKVMNAKSKDMELDDATKLAIKRLLEETKDLVDM
ncbi:MAG: hypothetical protein COW01_10475 [Bdellovibrionales bacterium CG12_big_fil_rev_8_21_14_0_65_38_15]|nr:MAG: hypothetical protein COW79_07320 [Bdellovibrionales bacterium CG22_combo_CG10-13_8_21_14_all_38_13]PIQ54562.1 MAG: hypothetical protein COW01_10475 [Bdellovibrionales bacterium CG12_big_fil_rev_8_21_14_0_65_38_15]PIR29943.1 MAG: hypothetical protein COV38_08320 [Bdellovibrionales bacterium CG11_big_fil_rev_8_21_14_0_20_38_13]